MVKVTYLYHSGFAVELDEYVLVFDYTAPEEMTGAGQKGNTPFCPQNKQLVVFFSHKHQDHFRLSTLIWSETTSKNTCYYMGNDIKLNKKYLERKGIDPALLTRTVRMKGGEIYEDARKNFKVEALRSTDQGVAFLVKVGELSIYHAGDLNHWYWEEEPKSWNEQMERSYRKEIDKIAGRKFDIAFVVLDPRLGSGFGYGMDYFLQKVPAKNIFPMHMWEDYDIISRYKKTEIGNRFSDCIKDVSEQTQEFILQI